MLELTADLLEEMPLPLREEGDKGARGNVLIIGGSVNVPGGALLSGLAALRTGAGRLRIATCKQHASSLAIAIPEAFVLGLSSTDDGGISPSEAEELFPLVEWADSVVVGPGLTDQDATDTLVKDILRRSGKGPQFVFDARAIESIRKSEELCERYAGRAVLTPHGGEMAALMDRERSEMESDPPLWAARASKAFRTVVAFKGAKTYIVGPSVDGYVCGGQIGLATSGSGDVLAGAIGGLLARGASPLSAACWGVYLHSQAGHRLGRKIGRLGFVAREMLLEITSVMNELS
jgi:ADP-dependent NAD(P)H-hydrate dehydratase